MIARIQRSPVREAGLRGGSGMVTGGTPAPPPSSPSPSGTNASSLSNSPSEKPTSERSKSSASRSFQFRRQQRLVPRAEFGQLVVGDPRRHGAVPRSDAPAQSPALRSARAASPPCTRPWPAISSPSSADEAGHGPTELGHAGGDLRDLIRAMRLGVLRVGLELLPAATSRSRPGRSSASWRTWFPSRLDTRWLLDSGRRAGLHAGSSGQQCVRQKGLCLLRLARVAGGSGFRVASQKSGSAAGDVPRFARQHTIFARKVP